MPVLGNPLIPNFTVIDSHAQSAEGNGSVFFWDTNRTYFVDYYLAQRQSVRFGHHGATPDFVFPLLHSLPSVRRTLYQRAEYLGAQGTVKPAHPGKPGQHPRQPRPVQLRGLSARQRDQSSGSDRAPTRWRKSTSTYQGAYAPYNWELFFHVPFFIANRLSANQRFEEALGWFHYIFDPTSTDNTLANPDTPQQKFWITKPFYETTKADYYKQKIENIMLAIAKGDVELRKQVEEWRNNPFNPHLIARMRTVAYQKNLLIKYVQTLIAWADQLFRRDTIETVNEATQLYILAASILGPRPKSIAEESRQSYQDPLPVAEGGHRRLRQRAERGGEPAACRLLRRNTRR